MAASLGGIVGNEGDGRPLLLLDVDGPLSPYAAAPQRRLAGYSTHRMRPTGWENPWDKPLRVWLNPDHGADLLALPYELVWATTWKNEANDWIGPHLRLPMLPFDPRLGLLPADFCALAKWAADQEKEAA